jgi:hypothetical protein
MVNTPVSSVAFWNERLGVAVLLRQAEPDASERLAVLYRPAGDGDAGEQRQVVARRPGRDLRELPRGHERRRHMDVQLQPGLRDAQAELALGVGQGERVEPLQSAELAAVALAEAVRLDHGVGHGVALLVEHPPAEDQGRVTGVEVVRLQRDRHGCGGRIDVLGRVRWREAVGDGEQAEEEVRVEVLQGKLALPVGDGALGAVRVAGRSEDADALARRRGADEDSRLGERPARGVVDDAGQGRPRGGGRGVGGEGRGKEQSEHEKFSGRRGTLRLAQSVRSGPKKCMRGPAGGQ